jgi:L-iditol 2-dehydrogenase
MAENLSAVLYGVEDLRVEHRPVPSPGVGQVLVSVEAVGICGSDTHYYLHGRIGHFELDSPMVIGHEAAGRIIDVGEGVDPGRVGQLVALEPGTPDRTCQQCLHGRYNLCENMSFYATPPVDGAIASFVLAAAEFAHPAPIGVTAEEAALAEPVAVGVWACHKAHVTVGDSVLVTGAGPVGLLAGHVAKSFGAQRVVVSDPSPVRREASARVGLAAHIAGEPIPGTFDVLLECSGVQAAIDSAIGALARAARVSLVGMGTDRISFDLGLVQSRELSLTGLFRYANCYPTALALIGSGAIQARELITHRYAIQDTAAALTVALREPTALKAMVIPNSAVTHAQGATYGSGIHAGADS